MCLSLFLLLVVLDFSIQFLGFLIATTFHTEMLFDLTGSLTFVLLTWTSWSLNGNSSTASTISSAMVTLWAIRLGSFLFSRILQSKGRDVRFNKIRDNPKRFFLVWMMQGIWVIVTASPVLVVNSKTAGLNDSFGILGFLGALLWMFGFVFEAISDMQKSTFRKTNGNQDKFIDAGLWSISRHPNYFGEIILWTGIFLFCLPAFTTGFEFMTAVSPIFVTWLLTKISGIPHLERNADKKWGTSPAYQRYKRDTAMLIPYVW